MAHPAPHGQTGPVTLLMGLRNGAAHLPDQLQSIAAQTHSDWHLRCSDDGSDDGTSALVDGFARDHPRKVELVAGPGQGFAENFMSLIRALPDPAGPVAFADQDDIWLPGKLARALVMLEPAGDVATLYCGRRTLWYPEPDRRVATPRLVRPFTFRNALVENVAPGNTIMLNAAAARLACEAALRTESVFAHDWWLYLLITGAGGQVIFDNRDPLILYRQHSGSVIGGGQGVSGQIRRKVLVLRGALAERMISNLAAINAVRDLLTPENRVLLDRFAAARKAPLFDRLAGLRQVAPYRQTALSSVGFWGAASLGYI